MSRKTPAPARKPTPRTDKAPNRARPAKAARPSAPRTKSGKPSRTADAPYHHGDLRDALLRAAGRVLVREGLNGLTLRAVAREAGVSHAAPTHHFGDLTGLLSDVAAAGFQSFNAAMSAARQSQPGVMGAAAMGEAYVTFARANPALFTVMFRSERLDISRPSLRDAIDAAGSALAAAMGAIPPGDQRIAHSSPPIEALGQIVGPWAMVHGFAVLLLDGRLKKILAMLPEGKGVEDLLRTMLKSSPPAGRSPSTSVGDSGGQRGRDG